MNTSKKGKNSLGARTNDVAHLSKQVDVHNTVGEETTESALKGLGTKGHQLILGIAIKSEVLPSDLKREADNNWKKNKYD
jgi:hypothetical protein